MITSQELEELQHIAEQNDGHCDRCNRVIKIYRYRLNKTMAYFMRRMADRVRESGVNDVDISTLGMGYSTQTQMTKIRLHGLIARVKDAKGVQVGNHWLITSKGWDFLTGKQVPLKVVVFDNQVLGHDATVTTIGGVDGGKSFEEQENITTPEAKVYSKARQGFKGMKVFARYKGRDGTFFHHQTYELLIDKLQIGKPVKMLKPSEIEYADIAQFQSVWAVVNNKEAA